MERWEGTLEYTMMAPVRRYTHLVGAAMYAVVYGLIHTAVILVVMIAVLPQLDLSNANFASAAVVMALGSLSFIGIGMMAAVLPLLYVERGAQMTFVIQSLLLLDQRRLLHDRGPAADWMQVLSHLSPATYVLDGVRGGAHRRRARRPSCGTTSCRWSIMAIVFIPLGLWAFGRRSATPSAPAS